MSVPRPLNGCSASLSDVGLHRTRNEDACLERPFPDSGVWLVADGMGGHHAGDVASRMAVDALRSIEPPDNLSALIDDVETRLHAVNRDLCRLAARSVPAQTIGTTVAALLRYRRQGACIWAGDSRVYLLRDQSLQCLTRDHTEVEELIAERRISREEAANDPRSNVITRAVGGAEELCLDVCFAELRDSDRYLLCSDGLYNEVNQGLIRDALSKGDVATATHALWSVALANGARDNVTVVVVDFTEES